MAMGAGVSQIGLEELEGRSRSEMMELSVEIRGVVF